MQHLARAYAMLTDDTTRTMMRLNAVFRGQAVVCTSRTLYGKRHHDDYLKELDQHGPRSARSTCIRSWMVYRNYVVRCDTS